MEDNAITCIIGLIEDGIAYMGGDSAVSMGWTRDTLGTQKVFSVRSFLIGFAGDVRMWNILKYHLNVPPQAVGMDDERYIVSVFVEGVRQATKDLGHAVIDRNHEEMRGEFLVAYKSRLYSVSRDFSVVTVSGNLYTCGSGSEVALGAMSALKGMEPEKRIKKALKIVTRFIPSVAAPFYVKMQDRT